MANGNVAYFTRRTSSCKWAGKRKSSDDQQKNLVFLLKMDNNFALLLVNIALKTVTY